MWSRRKRHGRKSLPSFPSELPSSDPSRKLTPSTAEPGFLKYRVLSLLSPRMTAMTVIYSDRDLWRRDRGHSVFRVRVAFPLSVIG